VSYRPERRRDFELRATIDQYDRQSRDALAKAEKTTDPAEREKLLALARALIELAQTLKGRKAPPSIH